MLIEMKANIVLHRSYKCFYFFVYFSLIFHFCLWLPVSF